MHSVQTWELCIEYNCCYHTDTKRAREYHIFSKAFTCTWNDVINQYFRSSRLLIWPKRISSMSNVIDLLLTRQFPVTSVDNWPIIWKEICFMNRLVSLKNDIAFWYCFRKVFIPFYLFCNLCLLSFFSVFHTIFIDKTFIRITCLLFL